MAQAPDPPLPDAAVALLLDLLEQPEPVLSASNGLDFHEDATQSLLHAGLLRREGFEASAVLDDEDGGHPISLSWSEERGAFGYLGYGGWISVPEERIGLLKVDLSRVLEQLIERIHRPSRKVLSPVLGDVVWDLGDVRLPTRRQVASLWFGRRLFHAATCRQLHQTLIKSLAASSRILLTSTPDQARVGPDVSGTTIIPVADLLPSGAGLGIDPAILAKRTGVGLPRIGQEPVLEIIGEGRIVRFLGESFEIQGVKQRAVVRFMYQKYLEGQFEVSAAEVAIEAQLGDGTRVPDAFKRNRAWGSLLTESRGVVRFCWPSEEDDVTASE